MSLIKDPSGETVLVTIRIKKYELAECLRRIPKDGTLQDALYSAFSFGLFATHALASKHRQLFDNLVDDWRSPYRRPNDARLIGRSDEELVDEHFGNETPPHSAQPSEGVHVAVIETATPADRKRRTSVAERELKRLIGVIDDPSGETILVTIRIKKTELAECLRRMPTRRSIHDGLYNAFSFGLFVAYELEEDQELLEKLIAEWQSLDRGTTQLIGETDDELVEEYLSEHAARSM